MIQIYKVKEPGEPVQTYIGAKLKKLDRDVYELSKNLKLGEKRIVRVRQRKDVFIVGVHKLHPRELTPRARRKICGAGLKGEARRRFIENGETLQEQCEAAKLQVAIHQTEVIRQYREDHPEQYMARERRQGIRKLAAKKRRAEAKGEKYFDISNLLTPADLASVSGLSPLEIRKFLRLKNIPKRGGRYAFKKKEAKKIIRAARKYYRSKEE